MPEKYDNVLRSRKHIFLNNFLGGIAWGVGATVGLSLFLGVLGLVAHYVNLVPFVGNFVLKVIDFVLSKYPHSISAIVPFIFSQYFYA